MRAKLQRDALFAQAEGLRAKLAFGVRVRGRDSRAMLGAKTGRSNAGAGQSDDQNVLAAQLESACHCFTPNLSDAFRLFLRSQTRSLPQFKGGQCKERKDQRQNPETHDHLGLAPTQKFKMMMDRRHTKNAFAAQLERAHLQNNRERFHHKNSADKKQQNFLLDDHRDKSKRPAQRERAYIAHENFRGMGVVPKKTKRSADQRATKNGKSANPRNILNFKVSGPAKIAAPVGEHGERAGSDDRAADGQAVETVGEIHGIRCSGNYQRNKKQKWQERQRPNVRRSHQGMND